MPINEQLLNEISNNFIISLDLFRNKIGLKADAYTHFWEYLTCLFSQCSINHNNLSAVT